MDTKSKKDTTNSEKDAYSLTNDLLFRKTFGENSKLLLSLVNSVFEYRNMPLLTTITDLNPIALGDRIDAKTIILDIKAKGDDGKIINVEMQVLKTRDYQNRSIFYAYNAIGSQVDRGDNYNAMKETHHISFLDHIIIPESPKAHQYYKITNQDHPHHTFNQIHFHYIEMEKITSVDENSTAMQKWVYLLKNSYKENDMTVKELREIYPDMDEALQQAEKALSSEQFREYALARHRFILDYNTGLENSYSEGEAKGKSEGLAEGKAEIVQSMHDEGFDIATIARIAKLSKAEVQQIIDKSTE